MQIRSTVIDLKPIVVDRAVIESAVRRLHLEQSGRVCSGYECDMSDALDRRRVAITEASYHELWRRVLWSRAPEHEPGGTTVQYVGAYWHVTPHRPCVRGDKLVDLIVRFRKGAIGRRSVH